MGTQRITFGEIKNFIKDNPECLDDIIRDYSSDDRYIPTSLGNLLLEMSGHCCTICKAPYCEIHHIKFLENGGKTEYDNLIVLCPNCHTRVHKTNEPTPQELHHYKYKQEIAYELPIINKIQKEEKDLILKAIQEDELIYFNEHFHKIVQTNNHELAKKLFRKNYEYIYLEKTGIIELIFSSPISDGDCTHINADIKLTSKGIKWIESLIKTNRIDLLKNI